MNTRADKHTLYSKLHETSSLSLTKAKLTSLLVVRQTPNFLKMCVIKFDSKSGSIKAKLLFSFGVILKQLRGGKFAPPVQIGLMASEC